MKEYEEVKKILSDTWGINYSTGKFHNSIIVWNSSKKVIRSLLAKYNFDLLTDDSFPDGIVIVVYPSK